MSRKRLSALEDTLTGLERSIRISRSVEGEKATCRCGHIKEELERARQDLDTARRAQDLARMSELQYGGFRPWSRGSARRWRSRPSESTPAQFGHGGRDREIVSKWTAYR